MTMGIKSLTNTIFIRIEITIGMCMSAKNCYYFVYSFNEKYQFTCQILCTG